MNDTEFFKEEAERFLSQACVTANSALQETLLSFSSGFANYATELEKMGFADSGLADQDETAANVVWKQPSSRTIVLRGLKRAFSRHAAL